MRQDHPPLCPFAKTDTVSHRLQSERQLEQRSLSTSSQAYDRNLLSKIGGPNTPNRLSLSGAAETSGAVSPGADSGAENSARHLSTSSSSHSERRHPSVDSSTFRWSVSSAVSPGPFRNPNFNPENSRPTALRHSSFQFDDSSSHRGSYDQSMFLNEEFSTEEGQMKDLNLNDRDEFQLGAKPGMKRRASSPHRDSLREDRSSISSAPGGGDLYTRRSLQHYPNRNSSISASRYAPSHHGSVSSASSYNPRNGSLASSYTLSVSSSATSYASGRVSPGMMSPAIIDPDLGAMGYMNAKPLNTQSPATQQIMPPYTRTLSDTPTHNVLQTPVDSASQSRHNSLPGVQGIFICDCCPKKPKKFTSEDDLRSVLNTCRSLSKHLTDNVQTEPITWRNNTLASIVLTASRIRMKRSGIRTPCIYDAIHGRVQLSVRLRQLSTHHPALMVQRIPAATVAMNFPTRQTGINVVTMSSKHTNLASVIKQRSSIALITSVNTSNTAMPEQAVNGPTCSRRRACGTNHYRNQCQWLGMCTVTVRRRCP